MGQHVVLKPSVPNRRAAVSVGMSRTATQHGCKGIHGHAISCPKRPRQDQSWHCGPHHDRTRLSGSGGGAGPQSRELLSWSGGDVGVLELARLCLNFFCQKLFAGCVLGSTNPRGSEQQCWACGVSCSLLIIRWLCLDVQWEMEEYCLELVIP